MREGAPPLGDNDHLPEERDAARPARRMLRVQAAAVTGAVGWTAIDTLKPPSASTWITSTTVAVAILALITIASLGSRDSRSPFERTMIFLCLMVRRPPGTYLPARPPEQPEGDASLPPGTPATRCP